jgi:hypothetical protein
MERQPFGGQEGEEDRRLATSTAEKALTGGVGNGAGQGSGWKQHG